MKEFYHLTNLQIIHKAHMTWHPLVRHLVLWMIWVFLDEHQKPSYLPTHIYISPPALPYHLLPFPRILLLYYIPLFQMPLVLNFVELFQTSKVRSFCNFFFIVDCTKHSSFLILIFDLFYVGYSFNKIGLIVVVD